MTSDTTIVRARTITNGMSGKRRPIGGGGTSGTASIGSGTGSAERNRTSTLDGGTSIATTATDDWPRAGVQTWQAAGIDGLLADQLPFLPAPIPPPPLDRRTIPLRRM